MILTVNETKREQEVLTEVLGREHTVVPVTDGQEALRLCRSEPSPALVIADIEMSVMDGFELCRLLKSQASTQMIPVVLTTSRWHAPDETRAFAVGAVDYLVRPLRPGPLRARLRAHLELRRLKRSLLRRNRELELEVLEQTRELSATQDALLTSVASLAETRDPETGGHILRTQRYLGVLAAHLKKHPRLRPELCDEAVELAVKAAPLHDIGKVAIPDAVLFKPGKLDRDEFEIMKRHAAYGRMALRRAQQALGRYTPLLRVAEAIAYTHHERWDGSGYPRGLQGPEIPLFGRLMAVADVYDALVSERCYKKAYSHTRAVEIITDESGAHFDPLVVNAFLEATSEFEAIARKYAD